MTTENPFFETWTTPFGAPPFSRIKPEHFVPAYERAFAEHEAEIAAIAGQKEPPTLRQHHRRAGERRPRLAARRRCVRPALRHRQQRRAAGDRARHLARAPRRIGTRCGCNEGLFARIDALYREARQPRPHRRAEARAGAPSHQISPRGRRARPGKKKRLAEIVERLAALGTAFSQNVLADEQSYTMELDGEADLAGLPDFVRDAAAAAADERGMTGKHVITLQRSSVEPFLQFSSRRDLREKAFRAWIARGDNGGKTDNKAIIAETMALRTERAKLLGYPTLRALSARRRHGEDAGGGARPARKGLEAGARKAALADRDALQALIAEEGGNFKLAAWDWRYYAEKLRARRCAFEESEVKPYFQLDRVIEAAFYGAQQAVRPDVPSGRRAGLASRRALVGGPRRRTAATSASSTATISPARASRAAPGWAPCATRRSSPAMSARSFST